MERRKHRKHRFMKVLAFILTLYVNKVTMFLHRRLYCLDISGNIF